MDYFQSLIAVRVAAGALQDDNPIAVNKANGMLFELGGAGPALNSTSLLIPAVIA